MWIVTQDRDAMFNTEQIRYIDLDFEEIKVNVSGDCNDTWTIATYEDDDRAKQVFEQLMNFLKNAYVRDTFYFPKDEEEN